MSNFNVTQIINKNLPSKITNTESEPVPIKMAKPSFAYDQLQDTIKISNAPSYRATPIVEGFSRMPDTQLRPITSDKDGTIYGYHIVSNQILASSKDGGRTATRGHTFPEPIHAIVVSANRIIVSTWDMTATGIGKIYVGDKSKGVVGPFEEKITMRANVYATHFGMNTYYDGNRNIVLINEYGKKTLPDNARRTYLSTDGGDTFNVIRTGEEIADTHNHAVVYDPYTSRIWVSVGDEPNVDTGAVYFSENFGKTWERAYPKTGEIDYINATIIIPTPKYVLFGGDKTPIMGMWRWSREREMLEKLNGGSIENAMELNHVVRIQKTGEHPHYARGFLKVSDLEYYISFGTANEPTKTPFILATGDGGETLHTIFMDYIGVSGATVGFAAPLCGLTPDGEIVSSYFDNTPNGSLVFKRPKWV